MIDFPPSLIAPSPSLGPHIPTILVDSRIATLSEAGELLASGIDSSNLIEIGELVDAFGKAKEAVALNARLRKGGMSLFKCVGVGGMDSAIAKLVLEEAEKQNIGVLVEY